MRSVQAAWRLGQWNLIGNYVSVADKEDLISCSDEDNATFNIHLTNILKDFAEKTPLHAC
jgi:hypothetical protein